MGRGVIKEDGFFEVDKLIIQISFDRTKNSVKKALRRLELQLKVISLCTCLLLVRKLFHWKLNLSLSSVQEDF